MRIVALIAVLAVIFGAAYIMSRPNKEVPVIGETEPDTEITQHYENAQFGISFNYPDNYVLSEQDIGNQGERVHHALSLMKKSDTINIPLNGEGPTAITLDIYGNGIDKQGIEHWIRNTSASNFKLSANQVLSTSTVSGVMAYAYTWDGLYRGDSVVLSKGQNIYMFSVTYMDSAAPIRDDFAALLASIKFR